MPIDTLLRAYHVGHSTFFANGVEIDRKLAALLERLGAEAPMALFAS